MFDGLSGSGLQFVLPFAAYGKDATSSVVIIQAIFDFPSAHLRDPKFFLQFELEFLQVVRGGKLIRRPEVLDCFLHLSPVGVQLSLGVMSFGGYFEIALFQFLSLPAG